LFVVPEPDDIRWKLSRFQIEENADRIFSDIFVETLELASGDLCQLNAPQGNPVLSALLKGGQVYLP